MLEEAVIAIDIGGTNISSGLVTDHGEIITGSYSEIRVDQGGSRKSLLSCFGNVIENQLNYSSDTPVKGVSIGIPGPFDYRKGISKMNQKFSSLYEVNLRKELKDIISSEVANNLAFIPDSWAFLLGEYWRGAARGSKRSVCLTLGTGLGSAFMKSGKLVEEGPGVPPCAWIGSIPYRGKTADDFLSKRGIHDLYRGLATGKSKELEVKDIARKAWLGEDKAAIKTFLDFGEILGEVLKPVIKEFRPQQVIVGGKISLAFNLFSNPLNQLLDLDALREIIPSRRLAASPLLGAAKGICEPATYDPPVLVNCNS